MKRKTGLLSEFSCTHMNPHSIIRAIRTLPIIIVFVFSLSTVAHAQGYLKAQGDKIVNERGENILLRGMGLGGWMLQEGYMLGLFGEGQQHKIKGRINALIGPENTKLFYDMWLKNHTRKIDIDSLKAWGFNSVRLPMHYSLFTLPIEQEPVAGKQTWLDLGFAMTDSLLAWCKANQIYLILDLHAAPGGQGNDYNISDRDPSKPSLWDNRANQEKTVALWRKLAERYKNESWIAAYDLLNEPNIGFENPETDRNGIKEQSNKPLKELLVEITKAIREADPNHIIIIEGNGWGNNYNGMLPPWDSNMVLSFHKYWNSNEEGSIKHIIEARKKYNIPAWLGETGENSNVWFRSCVALLERNNIGWAMWPLKKIGVNNPLEVKSNPEYARVLEFWKGKGAEPSKQEAIRGLMKLASDVRLENNVFHKDVIDAMIRQPHTSVAIPFRQKGQNIAAVDYDLGKINIAYYDTDSANYRSEQGQEGGNAGRVYRNDGVDIREDPATPGSYFIDKTEPGEWLQYTIKSDQNFICDIVIQYRALEAGSRVAITVNAKDRTEISLDNLSEAEWLNATCKATLIKGVNKIKVEFLSPRVMVKSLRIDRKQ